MALKTKFLTKFIVFIVLLNSFASCQRTPENIFTSALGEKERLTVALDADMPGYFTVNDENFGYQYDLLKAYAAHNGIELDIIPGRMPSEFNRFLKNGKADITAGLPSNIEEDILVVPLYSTSYVIMTRADNAARLKKSFTGIPEPAKLMEDSRVMISSGFKTTKTWDPLMDSMRTEATYVSSRNSLELMERLARGDYDFLICEKSESQLGETTISDISTVYELGETIDVVAGISPLVEGLSENFLDWFKDYRHSKEYAGLYSVYFEKDTKHEPAAKKAFRAYAGISEYDRVMKEVCEREGFDWRFMSAIAYNESRFNAHVVSPRGARGLMQIMPATARQFNIDPDMAMEPEINITLAAKLLRKIESSLKLPGDISYNDRMSIILASYNCGIGHVLDARRLASKYGADPNSWSDVSFFLEKKSEPEYHGDEVVKCGTFRGSKQTLAFVKNVMGKYNSYCSTATI